MALILLQYMQALQIFPIRTLLDFGFEQIAGLCTFQLLALFMNGGRGFERCKEGERERLVILAWF